MLAALRVCTRFWECPDPSLITRMDSSALSQKDTITLQDDDCKALSLVLTTDVMPNLRCVSLKDCSGASFHAACLLLMAYGKARRHLYEMQIHLPITCDSIIDS